MLRIIYYYKRTATPGKVCKGHMIVWKRHLPVPKIAFSSCQARETAGGESSPPAVKTDVPVYAKKPAAASASAALDASAAAMLPAREER